MVSLKIGVAGSKLTAGGLVYPCEGCIRQAGAPRLAPELQSSSPAATDQRASRVFHTQRLYKFTRRPSRPRNRCIPDPLSDGQHIIYLIGAKKGPDARRSTPHGQPPAVFSRRWHTRYECVSHPQTKSRQSPRHGLAATSKRHLGNEDPVRPDQAKVPSSRRATETCSKDARLAGA